MTNNSSFAGWLYVQFKLFNQAYSLLGSMVQMSLHKGITEARLNIHSQSQSGAHIYAGTEYVTLK